MAVDEVSCRAIGTVQEFSNLSQWVWIFMQMYNNKRTIIITAYCPTASASSVGAYSQQLKSVAIMKIQNDLRNKFWTYLNKEISNGYIKEKK